MWKEKMISARVLILIRKLRLGFHKNHAGQGRLSFVAQKIGVKSTLNQKANS